MIGTVLNTMRNLGNGQFTAFKGKDLSRFYDFTQSVQFVDYDNDRDLDVSLPAEGNPAHLYRNDGNLEFTDVTATVLKGRLPPGAGGDWADFDNDGDLDVICGGGNASGRLLLNPGDGSALTPWNGSPEDLIPASPNWGIPAWGDFDNDGWLDVYTWSPGRLFRNKGDGNFEEVTTGSLRQDPLVDGAKIRRLGRL